MNERFFQMGNRVVGSVGLSPNDAASQEAVAGSAQRIIVDAAVCTALL